MAIVSDRFVRQLNSQYRGVDRVTDVLSFPADPAPSPGKRRGARPTPSEDAFLGDIVIARGQARRQAESRRHPLWVELRVLALHGLLHLLGYDHERDGGQMARVEARLRRKGRLSLGLIEREGGR